MSVISDILNQIRHAVYGADVRENIALGIEQCYDDVTTGKTLIDTVVDEVTTKSENAEAAAEAAQTAAESAETLSSTTADKIDNMTVAATAVPYGTPPTVEVTEESGHKHITFGLAGGQDATVTQQYTRYAKSSSGTVVPSTSAWGTTIPTVEPGNYLWTKRVLIWNDDTQTELLSVSRMGIDGSGSFSVGLGPDQTYTPDQNSRIELPLDVVPIANSTNLVTSGGVKERFDAFAGDVDAVRNNLAIVEETDVATHDIARDQYVLWKGTLCKAKSAVLIGESLTSGVMIEVPSGGGLNNIIDSLADHFMTGYVTEGTLAATGVTTFNVTFGGKSFKSAPVVFATVNSYSASYVVWISRVYDVTTTGCKIEVAHNHNASLTLSNSRRINWLAISV